MPSTMSPVFKIIFKIFHFSSCKKTKGRRETEHKSFNEKKEKDTGTQRWLPHAWTTESSGQSLKIR